MIFTLKLIYSLYRPINYSVPQVTHKMVRELICQPTERGAGEIRRHTLMTGFTIFTPTQTLTAWTPACHRKHEHEKKKDL